MEAKQDTVNMQVSIADRTYPLLVAKHDEQKIQNAVQLVNDTIKQYQLQYSGKDKQDYLAMCLINFAVQAVNAENESALHHQMIDEKIAALRNTLTSIQV